MARHTADLRRLDGIIWAFVTGVAGVALAMAPMQGFHIVFSSFVAPLITCLLLLSAAAFYDHHRHDDRLASALGSTAQLVAFAAVGAPLSYVAAAATGAWPLHDPMLDRIDRALMFDWNGLLLVMQHWPTFHTVMQFVYVSLSVQMAVVVLVLGFTGRLAWLRVYMLAFVLAALLCIGISMLVPAEGAWMFGHHHADPSMLPISHGAWPVYAGLRDGSYRLLMAVGAEGIITFPSLHAGLALILISALWPVPVWRWIAAALNTAMLLATPIDGAHYLTDMLAGIAVAVVSLFVARAIVARFAPATASAQAFSPVAISGLGAPSR